MLKLLALQKFYINLFVYLDLRSWISIIILCLLKCEMAVKLFNLTLILKQLIFNLPMERFLAPLLIHHSFPNLEYIIVLKSTIR